MSSTLHLAAAITRPDHWNLGWSLVLVGFLSGAALGLGFHREGFCGGYDSFRRRIWRLGHIACIALGGLCVFVSTTPTLESQKLGDVADLAWLIGALAMPTVCFLSGWRVGFRNLFPLPVIALLTGVLCTLIGGTK